MKCLLFFAIIYLCLFADVILRKKYRKTKRNNRRKSKITKRKYRQNSFEDNLPPPPQYPKYGSLAEPNYPGLVTPLTTGTYSSAGNLYQAKPGDAIPYGTGYSYGNWQKIDMD